MYVAVRQEQAEGEALILKAIGKLYILNNLRTNHLYTAQDNKDATIKGIGSADLKVITGYPTNTSRIYLVLTEALFAFPCRDGCLSGCERKADCNPGWSSKEWSISEKCPLNVCYSEYGFCGMTDDFCGEDDKVKRPSCSVGDTKITRVIGYFEAWSTTQRPCYNMLPEEVPYPLFSIQFVHELI